MVLNQESTDFVDRRELVFGQKLEDKNGRMAPCCADGGIFWYLSLYIIS